MIISNANISNKYSLNSNNEVKYRIKFLLSYRRGFPYN